MPVRVVASVIEREGRLLLCERPHHKRHGGLWEFPGGKVEEGETDFEAVQRELAQELGVNVTRVGTVEYSRADPGSHFIIEFMPVEIEGEPACLEHVALAWVAERDLLSMRLAPSDREYALHRLRVSPGRAKGWSVDADLRSLVRQWETLWDCPGLADATQIRFSTRLTQSLGRCRPSTGEVRLRSDLREAPPECLTEVLCHEVAHVAVHQRFGPHARPHGPEWRALVTAAGYEPQTRASEPGLKPGPPRVPGRLAYEHRCPVCQSVRFARRPVPRWRCAECFDAGLSGEMVISHHSLDTTA